MIKLNNISKTYGNGINSVTALDRINLVIGEGEFITFAGPSGSGKTTLLNIIGQLDSASSGTIFFKNLNLSELNNKHKNKFRAENMGFIFQSYNLLPSLNVYENIQVPLLIHDKQFRKTREKKIMKLIELVGLKGLHKRRIFELSGGQQQRVSIARALVTEPDLILADEPTANLDSKTGVKIINLMHELNQNKGITFIFSSHDPLIFEKADRVIHLKDGRIENENKK